MGSRAIMAGLASRTAALRPVQTPLGAHRWYGQPGPTLAVLRDRHDARAGDKRLADLAAIFDAFEITDGQTLSFHHHYRNGDRLINAVVAEAQRRRLKGLTLCPSSLFPVHAPLVDAIRDETVVHIVTDYIKGPVADAISAGALAGAALLQSHGGRARAISAGQLAIDVAFIAAPLAATDGSATGRGGDLACGPLGYPAVDCRFARRTVVAAHEIQSLPLRLVDIAARHVDAVVPFPVPGDVGGIQSGTTLPATTPEALGLGRLIADTIEALGLLRDGLALQSGAGGYSLAAVPIIGQRMAERAVRGSFLAGGITGAHVDLLEARLFERIMDVQCFDLRAVGSSIANPDHQMMSAIDYASPLNPNAVVNALTVMLLGAIEVDLDFNVNVLSGADGRVLGGPGGHPDTAHGARLSMVTTGLTGGGFAKIVPTVRTVVTEGAAVDLVVTNHGIAVNPARPDITTELRAKGLPVVGIDHLCRQAAEGTGSVLAAPRHTERARFLVEHRDGALLDQL